MTRTLPLLLLVLSVSSARPQGGGPAPPAGRLEVAERVHDAGRVDRGTRLTHAFVLRNTGPGELHVDAKPG